MNKNTQKIINDNLRTYFQIGTKVDIPPRKCRGASLEHEIKKMEILTRLWFEGRNVVINGKLKNKQVPDLTIIDLENPIIYEILVSEKTLNKEKDYPFRIVEIK